MKYANPSRQFITEKKPELRRRSAFWWLLSIALLSINVVISTEAQAQSNKVPASELEAGAMTLHSANQQFLGTHLKTEVNATISGLVATASYKQSFVNHTNEWVEGVYTFPLPERAAIKSLKIIIGDRIIVGEIKEKQAAKRIYKQAKRDGKVAALTTQQRSNLFTQKVANIGPGERIEVQIDFIDLVRFQSGQFEWRLPTTLTPRYIPGAQVSENTENDNIEPELTLEVDDAGFGWAKPTHLVPDADKITPPMVDGSFNITNPLSINIQLHSGLQLADIDSPYHDIDVLKDNSSHQIRFLNNEEEMNRDFVLQWQAVPTQTPNAAVFKQAIDGENFVMLMLLPPDANSTTPLPRDIVFVVDTSGSMQGTSIQQAKASLLYALNELKPEDRFNIIEFNSNHRVLFHQPQAATSQAIQTANNWVQSLNANGGTEMYSALNTAFDQTNESERLQQIVFITDGAVGNEAQLFNLISNKIANTRLFAVGIGSAPNTYFMRKAAEFGKGSFEYIASIHEVETQMKRVFTKLGNAASTNIHIDWPTQSEPYPKHIGDLYRDEPLIAVAKVDSFPKEVNISGALASTDWVRTLALPEQNLDTENKDADIATLWARAKIDSIENLEHAGSISSAKAKQDILSTALKHKILSKFTAFIAVDNEPKRLVSSPLRSKAIPNQVAQGQTVQPVMYPSTSTTSNLSFWLGAFCFFCFMLVTRLRSDV